MTSCHPDDQSSSSATPLHTSYFSTHKSLHSVAHPIAVTPSDSQLLACLSLLDSLAFLVSDSILKRVPALMTGFRQTYTHAMIVDSQQVARETLSENRERLGEGFMRGFVQTQMFVSFVEENIRYQGGKQTGFKTP